MKEQNKTIWELPPREPIPRKESPDPDRSDRQSEGSNELRHKSKQGRPKHAIPEE